MTTMTKPPGKLKMPNPCCVLYTFARELYEGRTPHGVGVVKVARLTAGHPYDWHIWPKGYCQDHPGLQLVEIAGIEYVDDRGAVSSIAGCAGD